MAEEGKGAKSEEIAPAKPRKKKGRFKERKKKAAVADLTELDHHPTFVDCFEYVDDEAAVLAESVDIIQKTFELGAARSQFLRQPACALVYGVDFVLDARGRPMLLEVQTNPSTNNKEEFECFNQTAAFDSLMRASLAFDAHEESAELIYLKADAIEAMRQEARVNRGRTRRPDRQPPTADWPSGCRNFSA